jgi:hypothetical protein
MTGFRSKVCAARTQAVIWDTRYTKAFSGRLIMLQITCAHCCQVSSPGASGSSAPAQQSSPQHSAQRACCLPARLQPEPEQGYHIGCYDIQLIIQSTLINQSGGPWQHDHKVDLEICIHRHWSRYTINEWSAGWIAGAGSKKDGHCGTTHGRCASQPAARLLLHPALGRRASTCSHQGPCSRSASLQWHVFSR